MEIVSGGGASEKAVGAAADTAFGIANQYLDFIDRLDAKYDATVEKHQRDMIAYDHDRAEQLEAQEAQFEPPDIGDFGGL